MHNRSKSIGVFDSGFGGLDVLRGLIRAMPEYDYTYLADTERAPYGDLDQETIFEYTKQAVTFLFENDCELIIVACNTASSEALRKIQQEYLPTHFPGKSVLGILIPAAEEAAQVTANNHIGVLATQGTVDSGAFPRELLKVNPSLEVFQSACPQLVPLIEEGSTDTNLMHSLLTQYLAPLQQADVDTLILGCTHYGILEETIREIVGPGIHVLSETTLLPQKLRGYLRNHSALEENLAKNNIVRYYTTDRTGRFETLGSTLMGERLHSVRVDLTKI